MTVPITGTIETAQAKQVYSAYLRVTKYDELIKWEQQESPASYNIVKEDADIPMSVTILENGMAHIAGMLGTAPATGCAFKTLDPATGTGEEWTVGDADHVLTDPLLSLHNSFDNLGNLWYAGASSNGEDAMLKYITPDGAVTTVYTLPFAMIVELDPLHYMNRVEAVCWTPLGVIVALGTHRWTRDNGYGIEEEYKYITTTFFLVKDGVCTKLRTTIQAPNISTLTTTFPQKHTPGNCYINAIQTASNQITVYAQTYMYKESTSVVTAIGGDIVHKAIMFQITNNIESDQMDVIQVDEYGGSSNFYATGVAKYGSLFYLTGRYLRTLSDEQTLDLEIVLTSADGWNWSVGERNFLIDNVLPSSLGTMSMDYRTAPDKLYYVGHNKAFVAPARVIDGFGTPVDITDDFLAIGNSKASNTADQASLTLANEVGQYDDESSTNVFGIYAGLMAAEPATGLVNTMIVDSIQNGHDFTGIFPTELPLIEFGQGKLGAWVSPIDVDRWTSTHESTDLKLMDKMMAKTPMTDVKNDLTGFRSWALNSPFIGYGTCSAGDGNGITKLRFSYPEDQADKYCLPIVGIIFGGTNSDAKFNTIQFPLSGQNGIWSRAKAYLRESCLLPPASGDVTVGGFNIHASLTPVDYSNVWQASTLWEDGDIQDKSADYPAMTRTKYKHTATFWTGVAYEMAFHIFGNKYHLWKKVVDYRPAYADGAAEWAYIGAGDFTDQIVRKRGTGREYVGIIASTDTFAMPSSPDGIRATGIESSLSHATRSQDSDWQMADAWHNNALDGSFSPGGTVYKAVQYGKGMYISEDNTLVTLRPVVRSSGQRSSIITLATWDYDSSGHEFYSPLGNPEWWRLMMEPGVIAIRNASGHSFDTDGTALSDQFHISKTGCMKCGDEILKYWQLPGYGRYNSLGADIYEDWAGREWCGMNRVGNYLDILMVFQRWVLPDICTDSTTIRSWPGGTAYPADRVGISGGKATRTLNLPYACIDDPSYSVGCAVKLKSRGAIVDDYSNPLYIIKQIVDEGTSGMNGGAAIINHPITVDSRIINGSISNQSSICALVSGRGFYRTTDTPHDDSEPLLYYPKYKPVEFPDVTVLEGALTEAPLTKIINATRFEHYTGIYNSTEDHLRYICALAGVRNVTFENLHSATETLSSTITWLKTPGNNEINVSDFVLDLLVDLPLLSSGNALKIHFRTDRPGEAYILYLTEDNSSSPVFGINIKLGMPNSTITGTHKLIDSVTNYLSSMIPTGAINIRIIVRGERLQIEVEKQLAWAFNLDSTIWIDAADSDKEKNWKITATGQIGLSMISSTLSVTSRILELGDEVENQVISSNSSGGELLGQIVSDRHILCHSNPNGSIHFGRFTERKNAGNLPIGTKDTTIVNRNGIAGHVRVSGAEFGEWIDMNYIREFGYGFSQGNNYLALTVNDAIVDAKFLVRRAKEYSRTRSIECVGFPQGEPEDIVKHPDGTDYIITQIASKLDAQNHAYESQIELRKYIP